jgi:hypothetical protein
MLTPCSRVPCVPGDFNMLCRVCLLQIARWLPRVSLTLWGKILAIVLECVFLGFAIYGCTKVREHHGWATIVWL